MKKIFGLFACLLTLTACSTLREARVSPIKGPIAFHLAQYTPFKNALQLSFKSRWGSGYMDPRPVLTIVDLQHAYKIRERGGKNKISLVLNEQGVQKIRYTMNRMNDVQIAIVIDNQIVQTQVFKVNEVIPYVIEIP